MFLSQLKTAIDIFLKYSDDTISLERDEMFMCETSPDKMSPEDVKFLKDNNWIWKESFNSWIHYT